VRRLSASLEFFVQPKHNSSVSQTVDELTKWLEKVWCDKTVVAKKNYLWLEIADRQRTEVPARAGIHLPLAMISLGAFTSPDRYVCHWKSERSTVYSARSSYSELDDLYLDDYYDEVEEGQSSDIQSPLVARFEFDNDIVAVTWTQSAEVCWRMEISFDSLAERVVLITPAGSVNHVYLFIVNQPKLYRGVPQRRSILDFYDDDVQMIWEREVCFGSCGLQVIGSSNAIHLELDPRVNGSVDDLLQRLYVQRFNIYTGSPDTVEASLNTDIKWPRFESFETIYAWFCLITRGFKVTDQISREVIDFLQDLTNEALVARLLHAIGDEFDSNCAVRLNSETLRRYWDEIVRYQTIDDDSEDLQQQLQHLVKVRRILLTPTTLRALPAEYIVGNRVVRQFGVDLFVRVVLRDEDMELLSASACPLDKPVQVITQFLRRDLAIGDRRYHFLGCSNSQMRQHGFWMYASDGQQTVDSIRQWMGDLTHERCVATYVSRLGQFFSASQKAVDVDERFKSLVPDISRNGYCFTDGIGLMSRSLSHKVRYNTVLPILKSNHIKSNMALIIVDRPQHGSSGKIRRYV